MENLLFKASSNIFPISKEKNLFVYSGGLKLSTILIHGNISYNKFKKLSEEKALGTELLNKLLPKTLTLNELMLGRDIIKDLLTVQEKGDSFLHTMHMNANLYEEETTIRNTVRNIYPTENGLELSYLTDIDRQAQYISKLFKATCSTAQFKRLLREKHVVKVRLQRIKQIKMGLIRDR